MDLAGLGSRLDSILKAFPNLNNSMIWLNSFWLNMNIGVGGTWPYLRRTEHDGELESGAGFMQITQF